jgi:hypothetical protein
VESDPLRVLDDENDEQPDSNERCDRAATESSSARLTADLTLTLLCHGESPLRESHYSMGELLSSLVASMPHATTFRSHLLHPSHHRGDAVGRRLLTILPGIRSDPVGQKALTTSYHGGGSGWTPRHLLLHTVGP